MSKNQQQQKQHNSNLKCRNCATHRFTPPQTLILTNPIQNISNNNNNNNIPQAQAVLVNATNIDEKLNSNNQENQTSNQLQLNTNHVASLTPVSSCESLNTNTNKTNQQHNIAKQNEACSNADSACLDQSNAANSLVCLFSIFVLEFQFIFMLPRALI